MTPLNPCYGCVVSALAGEIDPIRGPTSTDLLFWNFQELMHGCLGIEVVERRPKWDGSGRLPVALRYDWPLGGLREVGSDDEQVDINCGHVINCLILPCFIPSYWNSLKFTEVYKWRYFRKNSSDDCLVTWSFLFHIYTFQFKVIDSLVDDWSTFSILFSSCPLSLAKDLKPGT
jgi:hypothetical protein